MKTIRNSFALLLLLLGFLLNSCTKDSGPIILRPSVDTISFTDTILPILIGKCYSCHPGYANLDLGAANSYSQLVNVPSVNYSPSYRVVPFDPENSVLYQKVVGNSQFGSIMPMYTDPLTEEEVWLIYDWIAQGALNN